MSTATFPTEVKIGLPPAEDISGAQKALAYAQKIVVSSPREYELAGAELQTIKARFNRLEEARKKLKAPILEAARGLDAFFDQALEPLRSAEMIVKKTMGTYDQAERAKAEEVRRKHEEEIRRARIEAERKAEEARRAAEAEARRKRAEEDAARAKADAAEREAREARERGDKAAAAAAERERREAEAVERKAREDAAKATQKGEEKAQAAMEKAAQAAAQPAPVADAPKAEGVSTRSTWSAKVTNLEALVKAVADGKAPLTAIVANEKALNLAAKSLKGELHKFYPGVEAVETKGLAVKA